MISISRLRSIATDAFPKVERLTIVHLLVTWGRHDDGELAGLLEGCGITPEQFAMAFEPLLGDDDPLDQELFIASVARVSGEELKGLHLLKGLLERPGHRLTRALTTAGLLLAQLSENIALVEKKRIPSLAAVGVEVPDERQVLLQFGRNLTKLAAEGAFDELCELPEEISRLEDVLLRKRKGNPILTGSAGVGKTALVELLAREAANNPDSPLAGWSIFEISLGKMVAGTKYRGEFEDRFERVLHAVREATPSILFIDEIHLLLGAGRAEGAAMDGANLIKPHLARDGFRVIGATTGSEYLRYILRDDALARRFQEVKLEEPAPDILQAMVLRQANALCRHHGLEMADDVVHEAIELTNLHLPNRRQPDKSIDLLDSALVATRRAGHKLLEASDLCETLARMTGMPINSLTGADKSRLKELTNRLKMRIVGQDKAVESVARCLIQRRLNLGADERPLGVFLFAGDTGVGKTELARSLAAEFYGDPKRIVRIDLAEYSDPGSVHKLIGAPHGFIGSEESGVLIEGLQTWPSCVLLFDELEKAHPDVHKLLLGLLDTGRITSAHGDLFEARQSVIVMTTNAVTSQDLEKKSLGFGANSGAPDPAEILGATFPREFLGRIDEIIPFRRLDDKDLRAILKLRLDEAEVKLAKRGVHLRYEEQMLLNVLLKKLHSKRSGARGIARLLERELLQPLALKLLDREDGRVMTVELDDAFFNNED